MMTNPWTPIMHLFFLSRPAAVFLAIMSIIIVSLNRGISAVNGLMCKVGLVHITVKLIKVLPKALDTSAAVMFPINRVFVSRAPTHGEINIVEARSRHAMFGNDTLKAIYLSAATRSGIAPLNVLDGSFKLIATVTYALDHNLIALVSTYFPHNKQSTISFPNTSCGHIPYFNMASTQCI